MSIKENWRRHGCEVVIRWYQRFFSRRFATRNRRLILSPPTRKKTSGTRVCKYCHSGKAATRSFCCFKSGQYIQAKWCVWTISFLPLQGVLVQKEMVRSWNTFVTYFAIQSFHLSTRVGESLANCLSILSITASSEDNDIFSSIRHKLAI